MTELMALAILVAVAAIALAIFGMYCSVLEDIYQEKVATDEAYLVTTKSIWKIRVCRFRKGRTNGQPVLLVHGANVNQHNFTSPRGRSLVDVLVDRGFDCWTVDLRGCRSSVAPFERHRNQITIDDYLNDDIPTVIQFIKQETGYAKVHYCGHSLGGMLLYAYVLKYGPDDIASGATLGAPLGFEGVKIRRSKILVGLLSIYPPFFGGMGRALIPLVRALRIPMVIFPMNARNLAKGLDNSYLYNMLEDPLPKVLRQLCEWVNKPGWTMDGGALDVQKGLETLDFPLFAIYGPLDPFVPVAKAQEFFDRLPTGDKRILICSKEQGCKHDYNHCDLAFGQEGQREVFAPIARWFETHSITERIPLEDGQIADDYQTPLDAGQRAEILSGESFAHLSGPELDHDDGAVAVEEAPESVPAATPAVRAKTRPQPSARDAKVEPKGPDLASVSAAITALRPAQYPAPKRDVAPISINPRPGQQSPPRAGDAVETPASVLKALSNASGKLDAFKKPDKGAGTEE